MYQNFPKKFPKSFLQIKNRFVWLWDKVTLTRVSRRRPVNFYSNWAASVSVKWINYGKMPKTLGKSRFIWHTEPILSKKNSCVASLFRAQLVSFLLIRIITALLMHLGTGIYFLYILVSQQFLWKFPKFLCVEISSKI